MKFPTRKHFIVNPKTFSFVNPKIFSTPKNFHKLIFLELEKFLGFGNENFLGLKNFFGFTNENALGLEIFLGFANENVFGLEISWGLLILGFPNCAPYKICDLQNIRNIPSTLFLIYLDYENSNSNLHVWKGAHILDSRKFLSYNQAHHLVSVEYYHDNRQKYYFEFLQNFSFLRTFLVHMIRDRFDIP